MRVIGSDMAGADHVVMVAQKQAPRFAYTIGLSPQIGFEAILAGGCAFSAVEVQAILNALGEHLHEAAQSESFDGVEVAGLGAFSAGPVDPSWVDTLFAGALEYFRASSIRAVQVLPDDAHWTIDVPNLRRPRGEAGHGSWRWLNEAWPYPVPGASVAATNLAALRGARVTEAARWESDAWELFRGLGS